MRSVLSVELALAATLRELMNSLVELMALLTM
jgi:hypothetical protein